MSGMSGMRCVVGVCVCLMVASCSGMAPVKNGGSGLQSGESATRLPQAESLVIDKTNDERRRRHEIPLQPDATLSSIAFAHSQDMLDRRFFSHVSPEGKKVGDRVAQGHRRLIGLTGENIWLMKGGASSTDQVARDVMVDWMQSPRHRDNILSGEFTHIGVGICRKNGEVRATQVLARVFAWTDQPVPSDVARGCVLDLSATRVIPAAGTPSLCRICSPGDGQALAGPYPLQKVKLDVPPGRYALKFMLSTPKRDGETLVIVPGPSIRVK